MSEPEIDLQRYHRQALLPQIGRDGQVRLASSRVLLIGCGALGTTVADQLTRAGVGHLTIVDRDIVELTNLQRQTIFPEESVGHPKAARAEVWVHEFDSGLVTHRVRHRLTAENAAEIIAGADLVLDGCDHFATRLAVSDACVAAGIPLLSAAVGRFQGQVGAFAGHLAEEACYRCFVGDAFDADDCDTCAEDGMLGAMAGWTGTFAALHAIRVLLAPVGGMGDPQWSRLHLLDGLKPGMRTMTIAKDPGCRGCSAS